MKFNLQGLFFSVVILCVVFNLSAAISRSVLAPEIRGQIEDCERDCSAYGASFTYFLVSLKKEDWDIANKDFSTCRWRCHRCDLSEAIVGMSYIEGESDILGNSEAVVYTQRMISSAITECIRKWEISAVFGCDTNPVESYTTDCVLY